MIPSINGKEKREAGTFDLSEYLNVQIEGLKEYCVEAFAERTGRNYQISKTTSSGNGKQEEKIQDAGREKPVICIRKKESMPEEAYELAVSETGIQIAAATERGAIWALTTVCQNLKDNQVPYMEVSDSPKCAHRGMSLDCARHFFHVDAVKKIIDALSIAKMNVLHWHLADDQGFRIESRKFPKLMEVSGDYYTQEEIREVVQYAKLYGVEVVPEIDVPGHVSAILAAYPQYSCSGRQVKVAKCGGIYPVILCAGKEDVFTFLEELLDEVCPLFESDRFHIGGDEAPKMEWKKCPHCQAVMKAEGYTDYEHLQGYFARRVSEILKKQGKTPICWNETACCGELPEDVTLQFWTLNEAEQMKQYVEAGGKWIYSDMFELYLDYPYSMTPVKKIFETVPHFGSREVPRMDGFLGMEACVWAEHITEPERLYTRIFPRIYALAETAWAGYESSYESFEDRLRQILLYLKQHGIAYTEESWWNPAGDARREEAFGYFMGINSAMDEETKAATAEASKPGEEFARSFMTKFFQPEDLPYLMGGRNADASGHQEA